MKTSTFFTRRISFPTPEDERCRLVEVLKGLCAAGDFDKVLKVVDDCLPKDDAGEFVAEEMIRMNKEKQEWDR